MGEKLEQAKSVETATIKLLKLSREKDEEISEEAKMTIQRKSTEKALNWIFENSQAAKSELLHYLRNQKKSKDKKFKWIWKQSLNAADVKDDESGIFYYSTSGGYPKRNGKYYKQPYFWLNIRHNGYYYAIMTFCQDVDDCTWNIHPLFGQIYFVKGLHKHDTSILPNYPCTTVCGLNQKFKSFENFLLERNYRTTVSENKHKRKIALTVDNLLSDQIKASEIICLFEKLVVEEETR